MKANIVLIGLLTIALTTTINAASSRTPKFTNPDPTQTNAVAAVAVNITTPTNNSTIVGIVRSSATNQPPVTALVAYITGTNGVGMKGGLPVMIKNACEEKLWARFKRSDGPGVRITVEADDSSTILLLPGSYSVSWGKNNMGLPVGQKTMVVDPNELELDADKKEECVATLRLTPE